MKQYYPIKINLETETFHIIWYSGDVDGVLCENNRVVWFSSFYNLSSYCKKHGLELEKDISVFDLQKPSNKSNLKFNEVLDFWNLIIDISSSVELPFSGTADSGIVIDLYNKLFYGSNPKAIAGDFSHFIPTLSEEEFRKLQEIIEDGIAVFKGSLASQETVCIL